MKLAFIVQRYGREILGGSETLARQLAERLSRRHEITVLTTTAQDYITWKNEYEPGEEKQRGVRIIRFPVEGERDLDDFNKFSEQIYQGEPTREQELEWLERQGPVSPELIEHLKKEHHRYELLIFFTYLYYPTYYGLQVAPEKSVLLPTAHDEPPLKLSIFKEMFQLPSSFLFNTEAEELLVLDRFPVHKKMRETIGMGMELLDQPDPAIFRKRHNVSGKYFLYAGRIDGGKGLEELFRYFTFYKEENPASGNLELILIGKLGMKLPEDKSIRYVGFVDEAEKLSAMAGAIAVLQSSKMESLSIVTLEAFSVATPVVANAASRVLVDHCRKANAGFYYGDFEEFEQVVSLLLSDRNLGRSLGKNGQRYIKDNYGWQRLLTKYELALRASGRPIKEAKDSRRRGERSETKAEARPPRRERPPRDESEKPAEETTTTTTPPPPEHEPSRAGAVSEAEDPDATVALTDTADEGRPSGRASEPDADTSPPSEASTAPDGSDEGTDDARDEHADDARDEHVDDARDEHVDDGRDDRIDASDEAEAKAPEHDSAAESPAPVEEPASAASPEPPPDASESPEESDADDAEREDVEDEVDEDVAHLPSFFRAAIPPKKREPVVRPAAPATPTPEPTPPPPPPEPPADGGLPEFFRPKPKEEAPQPDPASATPEPAEPSKEESDTPESSATE